MFRELMNFSYQRTALQAVGWYLAFFFMGLLVGAIVGAIVGMGAASFAEGVQRGARASLFFIIPYHILLALALLWSRWKSVLNIFLALLAILLSVFLGALGGLIPLAVLTTRPRQKSRKEIGEVFE
jgi:hypothetical protein